MASSWLASSMACLSVSSCIPDDCCGIFGSGSRSELYQNSFLLRNLPQIRVQTTPVTSTTVVYCFKEMGAFAEARHMPSPGGEAGRIPGIPSTHFHIQ